MSINHFSRVENAHYHDKVGKKMGYVTTGTTMRSIFDRLGSNSSKTREIDTASKTDSASFQSAGQAITFSTVAPNASSEVQQAWEAAAQETGVNGFTGGSDTQLSALFALMVESKQNTGNADVIGTTNESATAAIKKALARLTSQDDVKVNTKVAEYRSQEKAFYNSLLTHLG